MSQRAAAIRRHFLADLHLSPDQPELTQAFLAYLAKPALEADEIYLLGDIFEYWLGDDVSMGDYPEVVAALKQLAPKVCLYFAAGNRDFLLGQRMASHCGMQILEQPRLLSGQPRTLVLHGDQLCTDDHSYQRYRRIVDKAWVQQGFLWLPQAWRRSLVQKLRRQSQRRQQLPGQMQLTDANPAAADALLNATGAELLIHGHTHRPASHQHPHGQREVLPDWRPGTPQSFAWLVQDSAGLHRECLAPQPLT